MPRSIDLLAEDIAAQPSVLTRALPALRAAGAGLRKPSAGTIWITGCGDGTFAGQAVTGLLEGAGRLVHATSSAELLWHAKLQPGDVVLTLSVSGGTQRTIEAAMHARQSGAHVTALTLNPDSALAKVSHQVLALPYTPISRAIPHCLDYTMLLLGLLVLGGVSGINRAVAETGAWLEEERARAAALSDLRDVGRFFFLGSGAALGSAGYGAAKLHEAGGLLACPLEAENATHGAQFMMCPGDVAVLLGGGGTADRRTMALRPGLERMGLRVIDAGFGAARPSLEQLFRATFLTQALCLRVAEARNLDVSRPGGAGPASEVQKDWFAWRSGPSEAV